MNDSIRKFLNEEQDPKAVEKVTNKLRDLLMRGEEIGYIAVQKKPVTVLPDSLVVTDRRIIICKPKNLGLSMDVTDYAWDDLAGVFMKENILGSEFSFSTRTDLSVSMDYIPKTQARKIYTFAKEQLEIVKNGGDKVPFPAENTAPVAEIPADEIVETYEPEVIEEIETEEVTSFAEIIPTPALPETAAAIIPETVTETPKSTDRPLSELSKDELFEKLQNYKRLLDNGLILQGEYDNLKREILPFL